MKKKLNKGFFLTVEGIEGAGKTTVISYIQSFFEKHNIVYTQTREPGGTVLAERLRDLLLQHYDETVDNVTELLMIYAARKQNYNESIKPALKNNDVVLCDRFNDATFAYQGGGRGIPSSKIEALEHWMKLDLKPDLTLLLVVEPKVGLARVKERENSDFDRIEKEKIDFFNKVQAAYLQRANEFKDRFVIIDANQTLDSVYESIYLALHKYLLKNYD